MDLTEQAQAIADSFDQRIDLPKYSRVSRAKEALILKLSDAGKTQLEIAAIVGVSQPTVSRVLAELADTRYIAKAILNKGATTLAERVIDKANVAEAVDVLERIEVLAPRKGQDSNRAGVQIIIGMPNQPAAQPPVIDLSPVQHHELAADSTG